MLSKNLKISREKSGLSQSDVAESLNISRQSVSKWETGKSSPDLDNLIILSNLYNVSIDYLLKDNDFTSNEYEQQSHLINLFNSNHQITSICSSFCIVAASLLSCIVPLIGLFLNIGIIFFCIYRKEKISTFVWLILITCLIVNLTNSVIVLNGYFFKYGRATIEKVALL